MLVKNGILESVEIPNVEFKCDLIPKGRKRRPGKKVNLKYITVHNTGLNNVPADNFRRAQLDPSQDQEVSWHFTVDEKNIIQHLPITEIAWHAGNKDGNYNSIGIEVCEREGAEENAIKFIAQLLKAVNLDTTKVRTHKSWSGKNCPWKILPHWDTFVNNIKKEMNAPKPNPAYESAIRKLQEEGLIVNPEEWLPRPNVKYADVLIERIGNVVLKINGYDNTIKKLVELKVISTPDMWLKKTYRDQNVMDLIIKLVSTVF